MNLDVRTAASAIDEAYGRDPLDPTLAAQRRELLDGLAVEEHGIRFRYIPAGTFLMGSEHGDPDERPVHPVTLDEFWLAETTMSWSLFCELSGWEPPPAGRPREAPPHDGPGLNPIFHLHQEDKIRLQYCEDSTLEAYDWHAHVPDAPPMFGRPPRTDPGQPRRYAGKPMVAVSWQEAERLGEQLSTSDIRYSLPTEAQWEKAARGGLVGRRYPWGDEPPTPELCDIGRIGEFSIRPVRQLPPNGYGLFGMAGSVWEWTSDWYDSQYYAGSPAENPTGPDRGEQRVLRGGSWADCAAAATVSFRMSRGSRSWTEGAWGHHVTPTIGFRVCRRERPSHD